MSAQTLRGARKRAGLTQAELGQRVGRPQSAIARWEKGRSRPSAETLRELVRACGLELVIGLANGDTSLHDDSRERLMSDPAMRFARAIEEAEGMRRLRPASSANAEDTPFDPRGVLGVLADARLPYILTGSLAGALRGSTVIPRCSAEIVPEPDSRDALLVALSRLDAKRTESTRTRAEGDSVELFECPHHGTRLTIRPLPAGTRGFTDIRQDAESIDLEGGLTVLVASTADLARIAEASPARSDENTVTALRAVLDLEGDMVQVGVGH